MRERVAAIMAAVFGMPMEEISDDMAFGCSRNWDSLRHLNLIMALEDEFGVSFSDDEVVEMISLPLIVEVAGEKTRK